MGRFGSFSAFGICSLLAVSILAPPAGAGLLVPSHYYCFSDSPFAGGTYQYFYLEDFEDGALNTPGVSANAGVGAAAPGHADLFRDSVDCDGDGIIDGRGRWGGSYQANGAHTLEFTFDPAVLGSWPTVAGLVWTDVGPSGKTPGFDTVTFEAFDAGGASLGSVDLDVGDGEYGGETPEDRFFGVTHAAGISRITLTSHFTGDWTMDHLQYGAQQKPVVYYHLTVSSTTGGSATTPGEGAFTYGEGTSVPVAATPDLCCHFVNWTGTAVTAGKVANPLSASTTGDHGWGLYAGRKLRHQHIRPDRQCHPWHSDPQSGQGDL